MQYEHLLVDVEGPVATVTLNRVEVHNAMDEQTLAEIADVFKQLAKPGKAQVIVLKANGPDFCAGADIRWMKRASTYTPAKNRKDAMRLVNMIEAIDRSPVPVIALIHGGVYGGGLGVVAACDIVIAQTRTKMCFSECRLGILPAVVSSVVLPKIGLSHTRRLYLTSELFGMDVAQRVGLVHEVGSADEVGAILERMIKNILKNGPNAVRTSKAYLAKMAELPYKKRVQLSLDTLVKARSSAEGKEGLAAFLEKRRPSWDTR
ncbi:MAG: enoyl-CoA hydratase [Elusimicrobia bacterium]|nr:MAG: enoyl-CoA hydratase [Elusimicrobiota bacterium]